MNKLSDPFTRLFWVLLCVGGVTLSFAMYYKKSFASCLDSRFINDVTIIESSESYKIASCPSVDKKSQGYKASRWSELIANKLSEHNSFFEVIFSSGVKNKINITVIDTEQFFLDFKNNHLILSRKVFNDSDIFGKALRIALFAQVIFNKASTPHLKSNYNVFYMADWLSSIAWFAYTSKSDLEGVDRAVPLSMLNLSKQKSNYCVSKIVSLVDMKNCMDLKSESIWEQGQAYSYLLPILKQAWFYRLGQAPSIDRIHFLRQVTNYDYKFDVSTESTVYNDLELSAREIDWIKSNEKALLGYLDPKLAQEFNRPVFLINKYDTSLFVGKLAYPQQMAQEFSKIGFIQIDESLSDFYSSWGKIKLNSAIKFDSVVYWSCDMPSIKTLLSFESNSEHIYVISSCDSPDESFFNEITKIGIEAYLVKYIDLTFAKIHLPSLKQVSQKQPFNPLTLISSKTNDHPFFKSIGFDSAEWDSKTNIYQWNSAIEVVERFRIN